jgi:hypothetical protein
MNEMQHDMVLRLLREALSVPTDGSSDQGQPMVCLWREAGLVACNALVTAYGYYTNIQDHVAAAGLAAGGWAALAARMEHIHGHIANEPDDRLLAWLNHISRGLIDRTDDPGTWTSLSFQLAITARFAKCSGTDRKLEVATAVLSEDCASLIAFLAATNQLASALRAKAPAQADAAFFLAGYVRAHLGDGNHQKHSLLGNRDGVLGYVHNEAVEAFAQEAYGMEQAMHEAGAGQFPVRYTSPLGLPADRLAGFGFRLRHAYFSARLACSALMLTERTDRLRPYCGWVLARFLSKNYSEGIDALRKPKDASAKFADAVYVFYTDSPGKVSGPPLSSEYDSAAQWRNSLGLEGATASSAQALMTGTRDDAGFVREVFQSLQRDGHGHIASVAVASKLGVYFGAQSEPSCKSARGKPESATAQIGKMRFLCRATAAAMHPNGTMRFREDVGIVPVTGSIYFSQWPDESDLNDGFDWMRDPLPAWRTLTSSSHIENLELIGAHLWLYGKRFQEAVDASIGRVGGAFDGGGQVFRGMGDTFSRFVFIVPQCNTSSKELRDFPGIAAMKRVLRMLVRQGPIGGFDLQGELYDPIVRHTMSPSGGAMFVPVA